MKTIALHIAKGLLYLFCLWMLIACSSISLSEVPGQSEPQVYENLVITGPGKGLVTGRIYDELVNNPKIIKDFKNLGVQWLRIEFEEYIYLPAGTLSGSPEVLAKIEKFRKVTQLAHANGIKILGLIAYNSLSDKEVPLSKEKVDKYIKSVEWHLNTYTIDAVEIWNEPNGFGFSPKENLKWYGSTLISVYDQLKPKFPNVLFVGPATANAEAGEWLGIHDWQNPGLIEGENSIFNTTEMRTWRAVHNGKLPLDILSLHTYGSGTASPLSDFYFGRNFKTYFQEISNYKDLDGRSIIGNNPVWVTEFGWTSNNKPGVGVTESIQQSNYNAIMNEFENLSIIENVFLYDYKDDENEAGSEGNASGLVKNSTNNFSVKPIYYSFLSRSNGAGLMFKNQKHEPVNEVAKKYVELGGFEVLGSPVFSDQNKSSKGYLYNLKTELLIQHFLKKNKAPVAITYAYLTGKSYFIPEEFYTYYISQSSVLKKPKGDAEIIEGVLKQYFDGGCLQWINSKVVYSKN